MNNQDLISRSALKAEIVKVCEHINANNGISVPTLLFIKTIDKAPVVTVDNYAMGYQDGVRKVLSERPQGEWIDLDTDESWYRFKCSNCLSLFPHGVFMKEYPYCPRCGAKMCNGGAE